jgi:ABC-type polysaccharide/polyol phosphate export permease
MSAITVDRRGFTPEETTHGQRPARQFLTDVWVLVKRSIARIRNEPETLMANALDVAAAFGLALLFGYAFTWFGILLGTYLRSAEAAQQLGFILFMTLTFVSNAFVPTQTMPGWLRAVADWNPVSALAASCRHLFGNPNPAAAVDSWPMQHPELTTIAWSVLLFALFAPPALHRFRRNTAG